MKKLIVISLIVSGCNMTRGTDQDANLGPYSLSKYEYIKQQVISGPATQITKLTTSSVGKYELMTLVASIKYNPDRIETNEISIECGTYVTINSIERILTPSDSGPVKAVRISPKGQPHLGDVFIQKNLGYTDALYYGGYHGYKPVTVGSTLTRCDLDN